MARLRPRPRLLTCFYCGKRSDTRFDGVTQEFTCKYCDATNHLDENGEITDPPVATEHIASSPMTLSQPDTTSQSIFCATCLKNQRLFVASLAQYLPGDEEDDVQMDRDYYRFRRNLERRYPQICADCEAAAAEAIQRAEYTAKTDHLRKMMEMSRRHVRNVYRRKTPLDWVHLLAQAVWWGGLVLQMLWHLKLVAGILGQSDSGMTDPEDTSIWSSAAEGLRYGASFLPAEDWLIRAAITTSFTSAWWNPKFVQVSRGFTKQLSGFRQWYLFQVLICLSRYLFRRLDLSAQPRNAQLSAHATMAGVIVFVYIMSSGTIKTDTTPLFGPHSGTVSPKQDKSVRRKKEEVKTLAESLDDVLPQPGQSPTRPVNGADTTDTVSEYQFTPKLQAANGADGVDEMEWTPTAPASLPRSLKDSPSPGDRAFGQAPTHEDGRPFYYKAPPAPINPAHKLRNPPRQPALWNSAEKENDPSSFRGRGTQQRATQDGVSAGRPGVEFTKQNFFAPRTESAEDESLANMLGKTFSLDDERPAKKGWFW